MPTAAAVGEAIITGCAVPADLAGVGVEKAVDDLGQSALSGTILAEESVNLAWHDRECNVVIGETSRKYLTNAAH